MTNYKLYLPDDFHEYEWEVEVKGWFGLAKLKLDCGTINLLFYDPVRLAQTIEDDLESSGMFAEQNLVVVRSVTRANMELAAERIAQAGGLPLSVPGPER